jgi:hypothetical protein
VQRCSPWAQHSPGLHPVKPFQAKQYWRLFLSLQGSEGDGHCRWHGFLLFVRVVEMQLQEMCDLVVSQQTKHLPTI